MISIHKIFSSFQKDSNIIKRLWGGAGHLQSVEETLKNNLVDSKENIHILRPKSSSFFKTYDGIEIIGQRMLLELLKEIKQVNDTGNQITKISFVGYSLGGLVSRYIIGELEKLDIFDHIQPQYFTTFATPHLGVWFFQKKFSIFNYMGSNLIGLVGNQLFIKDEETILLKLAKDEYLNGLKKFKKRFAFANIRHDRSVNFYTAFITDKNPFDAHWDHLDISFDFTKNIIPKFIIKGLEVKPEFVNLNDAKFKPNNYKKKKLSLKKKLKYGAIILAISIILPIWLLFVISASTIGSIVSFFIVKTFKRTPYDELNTLLPKHHNNHQQNISFSERLDETTGALLGDAIDLTQYDSPTDLSREDVNEDEDEDDQNTDLDIILDNLDESIDSIFKNPDTSSYEIFNKTDKLPLDENRETILRNLNSLDWYKFAVHLNVLNAHDGIIARRGLKRSTSKGIAVINFFSHMINNELAKTS